MKRNNTVNVRFFHATPQIESVDVYINDRLIQQGLVYQQSTDYLPIEKGNYRVRLTHSQNGNILLDQVIRVLDNRYITIIALSETNQVGLLSLPDKSITTNEEWVKEPILLLDDNIVQVSNPNYLLPSEPIRHAEKRAEVVSKRTPVRFVNASPNAPAVDVYIDQTPLFRDLIYKESSNYVDVVPVRYNLIVRSRQDNRELLRINQFLVPEDTVITLYLTGLIGGVPRLEIIVLNDGITA